MTPNEAEKILAAPKRRDWKLTAALILSFAVVGMLAIVTPLVISTSNTTGALTDSTDIGSCRAAANASLTDARNDVDQLRVEKDALELAFNDALTRGDAAALTALGPLFNPLRVRLLDAGRVADARNSDYQAAVRMAVDDPRTFLRRCRANGLTPDPTTTTTAVPIVTATTPTTIPVLPSSSTVRARRSTPRATTPTTRPRAVQTSSTSSTVYRTLPGATSTPLLCVLLPKEIPCPV